MPSSSCTEPQHSTVVTMDGVTIVVSSPDLLKSLRPLLEAAQKKALDYETELDYSMDKYDP